MRATRVMGLLAIVGSFALAIPGIAARLTSVRPVNSLAKGYVHLFRNTPLLVLLYVLWFRGPLQSQPGSDLRRARLFEKRCELFQAT